jgi:NAD(P)-dependent dehydrogenase (short-subunit alcohol dehydrogenase family)
MLVCRLKLKIMSKAIQQNQRVAIVTGAASGIGWTTSKRLAQEFGHVVIADVDPKAANARASELGDGHWWFGCDVTVETQVCDLVDQVVARFGRLDVLVNNAGIGEQPVMTLEQTVAAFDRILSVHLRGTFLVSREAARVFVAQQSGVIVNISSVAGLGGHPGRNAYGASKAGISSMTEAMACEWARDGIRVNAVAPGYVLTDLVRALVAKGALNLEDIEARTPMGRAGNAEEIAEVIAFLASERASFVTGVTLPVDGGWLAFGAPPAKLGTVKSKRI